jgi:hypothetical protein
MDLLPADFDQEMCQFFMGCFPHKPREWGYRLFDFSFYLACRGFGSELATICLYVLDELNGFSDLLDQPGHFTCFLIAMIRVGVCADEIMGRLMAFAEDAKSRAFQILPVIIAPLFLAECPMPPDVMAAFVGRAGEAAHPPLLEVLDDRLVVAAVCRFLAEHAHESTPLLQGGIALLARFIDNVLLVNQEIEDGILAPVAPDAIKGINIVHCDIICEYLGIQWVMSDRRDFLRAVITGVPLPDELLAVIQALIT